LLIQTIPATYFTREIITAGSVAGSLSVFLLGIGAISGFIAMRLFFRPLIRLMDQLRQVQDMDLDVRFYNSYFTEVNQLERAFEDLVKRLKEYRNFLPDHLLNGKDDESSESATVAESKTEAEIMLTKNSAGSVHHSLDNQSTRSATGVKKNRMFAIGVEKKPVSIVTVRMTNIAKLLSGQDVSRETIISQLGQVIDAVHKIAKTSGGQVSRFDPEFIELVWNGMRSERNHVLFACNAASRIYKRISELTQHFDFCLEPRVFVSSGNAYVGNIGCSSLRQFTVIGEPTETIQGMNGLNDWGASVLIDGKLASHVKQKYQVRPVQPILLHESNFLQEPIHIYELGSSIEIKDDEWMYEMEEAKANSRWEEYTDAYDKFVAGNYNIAKHELMQYVENYGTDNLAERMITLCESYNGQSKGSLLRTVYTLQSQDKIQEI
jgi:HAMP domain-containing protein/class 3 adenylate cyclase